MATAACSRVVVVADESELLSNRNIGAEKESHRTITVQHVSCEGFKRQGPLISASCAIPGDQLAHYSSRWRLQYTRRSAQKAH